MSNILLNIKNNPSIFILLENASENAIRYFAIGEIDNKNLFTGMIHGYEGGGEYSECLMYKNAYVATSDNEGEPLEWEEQVAILENLMGDGYVDRLNDVSYKYLEYDTEVCNYLMLDEAMPNKNISVFELNFDITPPSYANTEWENFVPLAWEKAISYGVEDLAAASKANVSPDAVAKNLHELSENKSTHKDLV
ncbi:MAG: hypothetical protein A3F91_09565 [Flavobacteria bacterium RIFCSPLOWO2_12_FULL_35_11]|nr:MAG: hypothetical protein A3F91_09565 [Flavobacteria bacterium RIFCSPLOWO2_12_FULL_35_11]